MIEEEEARRTQLLRRAHEICSGSDETAGKNNETDWDELGRKMILFSSLSRHFSSVDDEGTEQLPPSSTPVVTENPIPIEHQDSPEQQQESIASETTTEKSSEERTESDTGKQINRRCERYDCKSSSFSFR